MKITKWAVAVAVIMSCTAAIADQKSDAPFKVYATIKELMDSTVDPAADGVWDSVAVISTATGVEKREPRTPEEWQEVRRHAVTLLESMNLVVMSGRKAAPAGTQPNIGELDPSKIDELIRSSRPAFSAFADEVRKTTRDALAAIDRRDVGALVVAGGKIDQACESCHTTYWYPGEAKPR
jgi:cytochrome c556